MENARIDITRSDTPAGIPVLHVSGDVDVLTSPHLRRDLCDLARQGFHHAVLDLRGVTFLDSAGLHALISGLEALRERGGTLAVIDPRPQARHVLEVTGLERLMRIYEDENAAVQALQGREQLLSAAVPA